jgi:hypothetical protein
MSHLRSIEGDKLCDGPARRKLAKIPTELSPLLLCQLCFLIAIDAIARHQVIVPIAPTGQEVGPTEGQVA